MATTIATAGSQGSPANIEAAAWPRIALVTPVFNSGKYIEATIRSVLAQEYPNLDYFIVDGGSTDGTLDIIRKYESQISGWISEPDNGMYDALNKGYARTSGEIMGWISATDMLYGGGLRVVAGVFRDLRDVEWITGRPAVYSDDEMTVRVDPVRRWSRYRFLAGANQYIMQEATFWKRSLWDRAGGYVDASRRYVSDFELWMRFFRHARLYPVDALIGGYRAHGDALGVSQLAECQRIHKEVIEKELKSLPWGKAVKFLGSVAPALRPIPVVRGIWRLLVTNSLYRMPGPDWPPVIGYRWGSREQWGFRK
jgi:glycosyltransferase involved in cell wall biosynthesis